MSQFKSQLTNQVTNVRHPKNTIVDKVETDDLQYPVRVINPTSKATGLHDDKSGIKLPELGERGRQPQGSSAMAII